VRVLREIEADIPRWRVSSRTASTTRDDSQSV
jgi:hypothetical protein